MSKKQRRRIRQLQFQLTNMENLWLAQRQRAVDLAQQLLDERRGAKAILHPLNSPAAIADTARVAMMFRGEAIPRREGDNPLTPEQVKAAENRHRQELRRQRGGGFWSWFFGLQP